MIRVASVNDIDAILSLEALLFDNAMTERMLQHELTKGRGWVWLSGEMVTGYILVRCDDGLADITRLGVHPEEQKKGIGKALLERALLDVPDVVLTVMKNNVPAMRLYSSHGFKIVAHRASGGAFIMRRRITSPEM